MVGTVVFQFVQFVQALVLVGEGSDIFFWYQVHFDQPLANVLQMVSSLVPWREDDGQVEVEPDDDRVWCQQVRMREDLPLRSSKYAGGLDPDDVVALEVPLL